MGDPDTRVLTVTYSTMTIEDYYEQFDAQIELHDCGTGCSECFWLTTSYNTGATNECFYPGVGVVGGYWNHAGDYFGAANYLVGYTLHGQPASGAAPTPTATPRPTPSVTPTPSPLPETTL